jgi:hypothetical protein
MPEVAAVTVAMAQPAAEGRPSERWLARASLALAGLAVVIVGVFAGLRSVAMLAVGLAAAAVSLAAAYFFLSRRGVLRWVALAAFILAPLAVIVVYALARLLWVAIVSAAAWWLAALTARRALAGTQPDWRMPERPAQPPAAHPYLIMNPKSGGGKVGRFGLKRKAEDLGAEVFLMDGPEPVNVAEVARQAVANGADVLGVAGGDGTQALVAGVAAHYGIPFVVITAGTRNHFALDLELDRENPAACLDALSDGIELQVDLGVIGGQTFVNNASFGAYAEVVQTPAYRDDKLATTKIEINADAARIPVGIDGEAVSLPTSVLCTIRPGALRVWVPRDRPGVTPPKPPLNWGRLRHLAVPLKRRLRRSNSPSRGA